MSTLSTSNNDTKDQFLFCICINIGATMAIPRYMVFLPRGLRERYLCLVFVCNPQWRFPCGISTLRSPGKVKSVAISAGMVWWSMVMWRAHFLDHAKINTLRACVCTHSFQHEKIHVMPAWCLFFKKARQYSCQWPGGQVPFVIIR